MRRKHKIIAIIAVTVILSMTMASFALAEGNPSVSGSTEWAAAGEYVTFTINTNNTRLQGSISVQNLEYEDSSSDATPIGGGISIDFLAPNAFAVANATEITYVFRVAADVEPGDEWSFNVTNLVGGDEAPGVSLPNISAGGMVPGGGGGGATVTPTPTPEPTPEPEAPPPAGGGQLDDSHKVGDVNEPVSAAPIVLGSIAVLVAVLGIFGYVKLR